MRNALEELADEVVFVGEATVSLYGDKEKGFGRRKVLNVRRFYLDYWKWQAVPAKLSRTPIVIFA